MDTTTQETIRSAVRERYSEIARTRGVASEQADTACCGEANTASLDAKAQAYGYSADQTRETPEGANLGLGCGNPLAIASLQAGETVLDLGSGAGFDCFLAARAVGENGQVIGVDMTHEMLHKARANAAKGGYHNVEFRLGEIEHLPVADDSVDVIISNCVINLSPDKPQVFRDAFRVLKPGGRLAISDVVATAPFPDDLKNDLALRSCCVSGASLINDLEQLLQDTGFNEICIKPRDESKTFIREWVPGTNLADYLLSASIEAIKPAA